MSRPFTDVKFCSTSISSELRSQIAAKIKAMGGSHSSNLMSDVSVLIVGDRNTEKYRFSVKSRSDVKFIKPEVIETIHSKWIENQDKHDPDVLSLEKYTMPIFFGFKICLSRINTDEHFNAADKFELLKMIQENGGEVSDSLTQSSSIVLTNEKSGKRYMSAQKWGIPSVHPLWIMHSMKRKAALDIDYYNIDKVPTDKIGEGSCLVWEDLRKRKRRRIIPDEDEQVKKNPGIWNSIMDEAKKQASTAKRHDDAWDEVHEDQVQLEKENKEMEEINQNKKKKKLSFINVDVNSRLFVQKSFKFEFFEPHQTSTLVRTVQSHSGKVVDSFDPLSPPTYIVIPSSYPTTDLPSYFFDYPETEVLTEFFIERCLHYRQIRLDSWGKPFYQPLFDAPALNICITGFQGIELLHVEKMIGLAGFTLHQFLNAERDIIIVNYDLLRSKTGEHLTKKYPTLFDENFKKTVSQTSIQSTRSKLAFARKRSIPILTITFLFDSFNSGFAFNINGRDCCIHCPKLADLKPHLRELTLSDPERRSNVQRTDSASSIPKLPSPIKNKRQDKWGRLVGRAAVSQFEKDPVTLMPNDNLDEDSNVQSTQIGYGGTQLNDRLKSLLNDQSDEEKVKSGDALAAHPDPRTRTRQGYRDMLNILGDNE